MVIGLHHFLICLGIGQNASAPVFIHTEATFGRSEATFGRTDIKFGRRPFVAPAIVAVDALAYAPVN
jgi:hypothetical protein